MGDCWTQVTSDCRCNVGGGYFAYYTNHCICCTDQANALATAETHGSYAIYKGEQQTTLPASSTLCSETTSNQVIEDKGG